MGKTQKPVDPPLYYPDVGGKEAVKKGSDVNSQFCDEHKKVIC